MACNSCDQGQCIYCDQGPCNSCDQANCSSCDQNRCSYCDQGSCGNYDQGPCSSCDQGPCSSCDQGYCNNGDQGPCYSTDDGNPCNYCDQGACSNGDHGYCSSCDQGNCNNGDKGGCGYCDQGPCTSYDYGLCKSCDQGSCQASDVGNCFSCDQGVCSSCDQGTCTSGDQGHCHTCDQGKCSAADSGPCYYCDETACSVCDEGLDEDYSSSQSSSSISSASSVLESLAGSLIARWKMDDTGSNQTVHDSGSSPNNHDGEIQGSHTAAQLHQTEIASGLATGSLMTAPSGSGYGEWIKVSSNVSDLSFAGTGNFSLCLWHKWNWYAQQPDRILMAKSGSTYDWTTSTGTEWVLHVTDSSGNGGHDGKYTFSWRESDGEHKVQGPLNNGTIYTQVICLMVVRDGSTVTLYQDNQQIAQTSIGTIVAPSGTQYVTIDGIAGSQECNGLADATMIFGKALSTAERDLLWNNGNGLQDFEEHSSSSGGSSFSSVSSQTGGAGDNSSQSSASSMSSVSTPSSQSSQSSQSSVSSPSSPSSLSSASSRSSASSPSSVSSQSSSSSCSSVSSSSSSSSESSQSSSSSESSSSSSSSSEVLRAYLADDLEAIRQDLKSTLCWDGLSCEVIASSRQSDVVATQAGYVTTGSVEVVIAMPDLLGQMPEAEDGVTLDGEAYRIDKVTVDPFARSIILNLIPPDGATPSTTLTAPLGDLQDGMFADDLETIEQDARQYITIQGKTVPAVVGDSSQLSAAARLAGYVLSVDLEVVIRSSLISKPASGAIIAYLGTYYRINGVEVDEAGSAYILRCGRP